MCRYRADDVVNLYATALTLATPAAVNARGRAPEDRFYLPITRPGPAVVTGRVERNSGILVPTPEATP